MRCSMPNCKNSSSKNRNLSFFNIPIKQREEWLKILNYPNKMIDSIRVCSDHFLKCDYEVSGSVRRLRKGVKPTIDVSSVGTTEEIVFQPCDIKIEPLDTTDEVDELVNPWGYLEMSERKYEALKFTNSNKRQALQELSESKVQKEDI